MNPHKLCILVGRVTTLDVLDPSHIPTVEGMGYEVLAIGDCDPRLSGLGTLAAVEPVPADGLERIRELLSRPMDD